MGNATQQRQSGWYPCGCSGKGGTSTTSSRPFSVYSSPLCGSNNQLCAAGTLSQYYLVEFDGIADSTCGSCDSLNGSFVVSSLTLNTCLKGYTFDPRICSDNCGAGTNCRYDSVLIFFGDSLGSDVAENTLFVHLLASCSPNTIVDQQKSIKFRKSLGADGADCLLNGVDVPLFQDSDCGGGAKLCDASGATCTVTAIPPP